MTNDELVHLVADAIYFTSERDFAPLEQAHDILTALSAAGLVIRPRDAHETALAAVHATTVGKEWHNARMIDQYEAGKRFGEVIGGDEMKERCATKLTHLADDNRTQDHWHPDRAQVLDDAAIAIRALEDKP